MSRLTLTYSLADQVFQTTKSVGIFNVSTQLLQNLALRPEFSGITLFSNSRLGASIQLPKLAEIQNYDEAIGGKIRRILWDQFGVYRAARRVGGDWLFLPKGFASFCRLPPAKLAVILHDTMFDHYERCRPTMSPSLESAYFKKCFRATLTHASVVFTTTRFGADEIRRVATDHGWRVPRIEVMGLGLEQKTKKTGPVTATKRIFVLAGKFPHKRSETAVEYLRRWHLSSRFDGTVDWIGGLPKNLTLPQVPGWRSHQRLPEREYNILLEGSKVLVYFSEYEGFGMPPAEAVLSGVCPVFSAIPATVEVMGACGFSFRNESYESFTVAMQRALAVQKPVLDDWGRDLRARYSWAGSAEVVGTTMARISSQ